MEQWNTIYIKNAPRMLGICRRYVKDIAQAEDLLHEAFITAIHKSNTYSGKGTFEGWLRAIVINTALQYLRSRKNIPFAEVLSQQTSYHSEPAEESESSPESNRSIIENGNFTEQELLETIDELPEHHKTVFNLYVIDGYKHKQIGNMLNISPGTSKSHLARARKKIQQLLFEKTQQRNEDKNRKRAFLLLFSPNDNYLDKLYKNTFQSFETQPKKFIHLKDGSLTVNTRESFSILKAIANNKAIFIPAISLSVISAIYFSYPKDAPIKRNDIQTAPKKIEQKITVKATDSINPLVKQQPVPKQLEKGTHLSTGMITKPVKTIKQADNDKKTNGTIPKEQVVIHKSVVKHDTIVKKHT
jgi:RNA polymerase sigma factor (sigma-70 family)